MALYVRNTSGAPITLAAPAAPPVVIPHNTTVNVTSELSGLTLGQYTALEGQRAGTGGTLYYWWTTATPAYPPTPLVVQTSAGAVAQGAPGLDPWVVSDAGLGTEAAPPPSGTGVRGWLANIYARLGSGITSDVTDRVGRLLGVARAQLYDSGGTAHGAANPVRVDPTGSTAQPVTDGGGSLTVDGTVAVSGTPNVNVTNTPSVTISGTPNVAVPGGVVATISGTPNVAVPGGVTAAQGNAGAQAWLTRLLDAGGTALATLANPLRVDPTGTTTQPVDPTDRAARLLGIITNGDLITQNDTLAAQKARIIAGYDSGTNRLHHVGVSHLGSLLIRPDQYSRTRFGRTRVCETYTQAEFMHRYGDEVAVLAGPRALYETATATGGTVTWDSSDCSYIVACTATNGSRARLRSHHYHRYQPGKQQTFQITGATSAVPNTVRLVVRSAGSDTQAKQQSDWNQDIFNGVGAINNPSGLNLNVTKANLYEMQMGFLGVDGVNFVVDGHLAHLYDFANTLTGPYMTTPYLPLQVEAYTTGGITYLRWGFFDDNEGLFYEAQFTTPAAVSFRYICAHVGSEGGSPPWGAPTSYARAMTGVGGTLVPAFSIRLAQTYGAPRPNRTLLLPKHLWVASDSAKRVRTALFLNATLTGATFAATPPTGSACEVDTAATVIAGGNAFGEAWAVAGGFGQLDISSFFDLRGCAPCRSGFDTASDVLTVAVVNEDTVTADMRAGLTWAECR